LIKRIRIGYKASLIGVAGSWNTRPPRSTPNPIPYPHHYPNSDHCPYPYPEGPYTNVLDLQMFPAMSKRHSELLQMYSNNEANAERIWKAACQVWESCSSSMVCRAFVHAYRIMATIIEHDGHNHWLVDGTPHCHVRRDYRSRYVATLYLIMHHRMGQTASYIMFFCFFTTFLTFSLS
jgi:hypothetical protein